LKKGTGDKTKRSQNKKIAELKKTLEKIEQELSILRKFRRSPQTEKLERHLQGERSYILRQIHTLTSSPKEQEDKKKRLVAANKNRSEKMKRIWRFRKAIKKNYAPEKTEKEIGTLYKKHREGLETDIPDVAWRNPSP
jgi:hypothetical protein